MGRIAYSQLKPAWHLDRIQTLREGRIPAPVHVQLILSDLCNQDCSFCAYRMSGGLSTELFGTAKTHNPNRQIPTEKALEIVDDCAQMGVRAIQFTGGGEPTVHSGLYEIAGRAQSHGIQTALVTNGVRLDVENPSVLGMQWIRVSVDAGSEATYSRVRRVSVSHWRKVWANIESLAGRYSGVLGVGFVVTPDNYTEVEACARMARDAGASSLRVGAVFSEAGLSFYGGKEAVIAEAIQEAKARVPDFEIIDLFGRRLGDLEHGSPTEAFCGYQYFTMYIGGDLGVYRCCNTAYTLSGKVGSLDGVRLIDADLSYADFDARGCRFCQFLGQNEAISALTTQPEHPDFV